MTHEIKSTSPVPPPGEGYRKSIIVKVHPKTPEGFQQELEEKIEAIKGKPIPQPDADGVIRGIDFQETVDESMRCPKPWHYFI